MVQMVQHKNTVKWYGTTRNYLNVSMDWRMKHAKKNKVNDKLLAFLTLNIHWWFLHDRVGVISQQKMNYLIFSKAMQQGNIRQTPENSQELYY